MFTSETNKFYLVKGIPVIHTPNGIGCQTQYSFSKMLKLGMFRAI